MRLFNTYSRSVPLSVVVTVKSDETFMRCSGSVEWTSRRILQIPATTTTKKNGSWTHNIWGQTELSGYLRANTTLLECGKVNDSSLFDVPLSHLLALLSIVVQRKRRSTIFKTSTHNNNTGCLKQNLLQKQKENKVNRLWSWLELNSSLLTARLDWIVLCTLDCLPGWLRFPPLFHFPSFLSFALLSFASLFSLSLSLFLSHFSLPLARDQEMRTNHPLGVCMDKKYYLEIWNEGRTGEGISLAI